MRRSLLLFVAAAVLGGCVTVDQAEERKEQKEMVTGSNIPRKDRGDASVYSKEAVEQLQRTAQPMRDPQSMPGRR